MISSFQHLAKFQAHGKMENNLENSCILCIFEKHTVFCLFLKTTSIGYGDFQHSFSLLWYIPLSLDNWPQGQILPFLFLFK